MWIDVSYNEDSVLVVDSCMMCVCVCVVSILIYLVQLGRVFSINLVFLVNEKKMYIISKCESPIILKLFLNISITLKQIHIFKTSVIAQLIILHFYLSICFYIYFLS